MSSSAPRTPVAESARTKTQVMGVVGTVAIAACLSFADFFVMAGLYRLRKVELALSFSQEHTAVTPCQTCVVAPPD